MSYLSSGGNCCGAGYGGYGFAPAVAAAPGAINAAGNLISAAGNIIGDIGDVLGIGHPADRSRITGANQLAAQAANGDRVALLRLRCLGGVATGTDRAEYTQLTGSTDCQPFATDDTRKYAADLANKLSSPGAVLGTAVGGAVRAGASLASNPLVVGGLVLGGLWLATSGGGRRSRS